MSSRTIAKDEYHYRYQIGSTCLNHSRVWNRDTTECGQDNAQERIEQDGHLHRVRNVIALHLITTHLHTRGDRSNQLTQRDTEKLQEDNHHELEASSI